MKKLFPIVAAVILVGNLNAQKVDCMNKNQDDGEEWTTVLQELMTGNRSYPDQGVCEIISGFSSGEDEDEDKIDHAALFTHTVGVMSKFNAIYFTRPNSSLSLPNQALSNLLLKTLRMMNLLQGLSIWLQLELEENKELITEDLEITKDHVNSVGDANLELKASKKSIRVEFQLVWPVFREYINLIEESVSPRTKEPRFIFILNQIKICMNEVEQYFSSILLPDTK